MNRIVITLVFIVGLLLGTGLLMAVAKAQPADPGFNQDQTEPSMGLQPEKGLPRLSMA